MAKKQKDTVNGQLLPWNAALALLGFRDQLKTPNRVHPRSRQLIEEMAEHEFNEVVGNYLYGGG